MALVERAYGRTLDEAYVAPVTVVGLYDTFELALTVAKFDAQLVAGNLAQVARRTAGEAPPRDGDDTWPYVVRPMTMAEFFGWDAEEVAESPQDAELTVAYLVQRMDDAGVNDPRRVTLVSVTRRPVDDRVPAHLRPRRGGGKETP